MNNRLPLAHFLPPSPGDRILAGAYGAEISLLRFEDDEGNREASIEFKITGSLSNQADARALLASLLESFNRPAEKGGEHYV